MAEYGIEYFLSNQDEFNKLTEEQVIALSNGETVEIGDTGKPDSEVTPAPAAAAEETKTDDSEQPKAGEEVKTDEPVLLAKDGKHTIPYSRLTEVQEKAAQLETALKEKDALIADLQAAKAQDAKTGGTEAQEAVIAEYQGEFPEVANDLKPFLQSMIDAGVNAKTAELQAKLDAALAPVKQASADKAENEHFTTIKGAVPDFDQLVESNAVADWIKTQPKFLQASMQEVYEKGTASDVIELFTAYKDAHKTEVKAPEAKAPSKEELQAAASKKLAEAKGKTPTSLSELPSGTMHEPNELAAEAGMSAMQLFAKMQNMSPDKILKHLGRVA